MTLRICRLWIIDEKGNFFQALVCHNTKLSARELLLNPVFVDCTSMLKLNYLFVNYFMALGLGKNLVSEANGPKKD